jgi:DNA-binding NarL/FixJ family response regulator
MPFAGARAPAPYSPAERAELAGSFELLMTLIRTETTASATPTSLARMSDPLPAVDHDEPPALTEAPSVEQTVRLWHKAGHSQRAIARQLNIDRRKVKRIIDRAA